MSQTLSDLGERRILREIIPRYVKHAGDDCAGFHLPTKQLVVTTDPVPLPAAHVIGQDDDPFWLGWLLVTINASDIAASGARPQGFLAALDLPGTMTVAAFERLLDGIRTSCEANGLQYIGGNLREAQSIAAVGTAFGSSVVSPLQRRGAQVGERIVILGRSGGFWADALRYRSGKAVDKKTSPLFAPVSQATVAYHLHERELLSCAMDTSDGLAPTLEELALVNDVVFEVDVKRLREQSAYSDVPIRSERLWFGWGDWTIVSTVNDHQLDKIAYVMAELQAPWSVIGRVTAGRPGVMLVDGERQIRAQRLESERFAANSWFTQGIQEYIRRLEVFELP